MVGRDDPITSTRAAERVSNRKWTLRQRVEDFARRCHYGFIDADLLLLDPDAPESSLRKRRTELADENRIIASEETRKNDKGQDCIVWYAREHVSNPPPLRAREKKPSRFAALQESNARLRAEVDAERAATVTFLRDKAEAAESIGRHSGLIAAADSIERGEHRA